MDKYLYHGSRVEVREPDISYSRTDIDFGGGFYLTCDFVMANKWACNKNHSVLNKYLVDLSDLKVKEFAADVEWLDFVASNRQEEEPPIDYSDYDVLIGPTADDKMFNILDMYMDGLISAENAVRIINIMEYASQVVFKNQDAIRQGLHFVDSKVMVGSEKQQYIDAFKRDRQLANEKTQKLLREINGR